ncbi:MAG: FkbM family methyltransferase [Burkholderiales bacterium]|nr:FkbM family methyltransferase [Phycisphaerae bacterium]
MSLRSQVKRMFLGPPGERPRDVKHGLLNGCRFNINTSSKSMRLIGFDEREIAEHVRIHSAKAATAFDIGANDGWYSVYFATRANMKKVFAFDGSAQCLTRLSANMTLNQPAIQAQVEVVNKMVGDRNDGDFVTVDSFADQIIYPCVLKVDVDGGEMDVFNGAGKVLAHQDVSVILETHSVELERDCRALLEKAGYRCQIVDIGWYRKMFPEARVIAHNRWMIASR